MADSTNYLPTRDTELVGFADNFSTKITAGPVVLGLTAAQATAFATLASNFSDAMDALEDPQTQAPFYVAAKNAAKEALIDGPGGIRELVALVQAHPGITREQLVDLRLTVRDTEPSPIPVPTAAPQLTVVSRFNRTVKIRLKDSANPDNKGRPDGVDGALVFGFVGENPPVGMENWPLKANATRTVVDITFADDVPASAKVWLTAYWYNPRGKSGPACTPVSTNIDSTASMAA